MDFDPVPYNPLYALAYWAISVAVLSAVALFVGYVVSVVSQGMTDGTRFFGYQVKRFGNEVTSLSLGRIWTLGQLAITESLRRKALWIFAVFALLFMFAGWFLGSSEYSSAEPYISFVLTVISFLSLPLAVLLSCWGLPADIKARSLHTVVTKPVRRSEIVIGRIVGYSLVTAAIVAIMGLIGYVWITRSVPNSIQDQLIGRVPDYPSELSYLDESRSHTAEGINVGDIWEYRSYIEGAKPSRAIYLFSDLDFSQFDENHPLRMEYNFEVFRSYKGDVGEKVVKGEADRAVGVQAQFEFVNPGDLSGEIPNFVPPSRATLAMKNSTLDDDVRVRFPQLPFEVKEFQSDVKASVLEVPMTITGQDPNGQIKDFSLAEELAFDSDGDGVKDALMIEVRCVDSQQYLGLAKADLFIRLPDRPFFVGYTKAVLGGILLTAILVIIIGTTASTFVKGPVATLLTLGVVLLGFGFARNFADDYIGRYIYDGKIAGGGPVESLYRLVTQRALAAELPDSMAMDALLLSDKGLIYFLKAAFSAIPDLRPFDMGIYVQKGFDVPFETTYLPSLLTVIGFFIPCVILGYFSLQLRELEAK